MKVTAVGCGDAFGTGGRFHACWRLDAGGRVIVVDFGASSIVAWAKLSMCSLDIDAVVISHLHGDHFGGLPFLILESQYVRRRAKPLTIIGPPGMRARLVAACEALFPGSSAMRLSFALDVHEVEPGAHTPCDGFALQTVEVRHPSGAPATAVRIEANGRSFAYSGDTEWVDALTDIANDADLFVCECYAGRASAPYHLDWGALSANLPILKARRVVATHLGPAALGLAHEMIAAGVEVAYDGLVVEL